MDSNYMYVKLFKVVPQLINAWLCFALCFYYLSPEFYLDNFCFYIFKLTIFSEMSNMLLIQSSVVVHLNIVFSSWEVIFGSFLHLLSLYLMCSISLYAFWTYRIQLQPFNALVLLIASSVAFLDYLIFLFTGNSISLGILLGTDNIPFCVSFRRCSV